MKPKKQCNRAGCRVLIEYNKTYCEKHKPERTSAVTYNSRKKRGGKYFLFYKSKSWKQMSYQYRLNHPCCEQCLAFGRIKKADVVDHIIEIKDDYSKRLDENNLQSLCHSCHNRKTANEKEKRKIHPKR